MNQLHTSFKMVKNESDFFMKNDSGVLVKNDSALLDSLNSDMTATLLPAIVVVSIYLIVGLFGNPLVVLYYGYHGRSSSSNFFIVAMAIFDLMICCVSMPMEIVDMCFTYTFPSTIMCKLFRFVNYFGSISSGCILIAIAVDRYRKVCQPFKKQITKKISKIIIFSVTVFSFCVSFPSFVIYEIVTVNTTEPGILGYDCTTNRSDNFKFFILVFNGVCFLIFLMCITSLIVLYILVGRKLVLLKRFRFSTRSIKLKCSAIKTPPTSSSDVHSPSPHTENMDLKHFSPCCNKTKDEHTKSNIALHNCSINDSDIDDHKHQVGNNKFVGKDTSLPRAENETPIEKGCIKEEKPSRVNNKRGCSFRRRCMARGEKKSRSQYIHLKKYTLLMFSISTAFIISFLPYLGILTWRTLVQTHEGNLFSDSGYAFYNISIRSWLISSVVNPFIYGFFNTDFRLYVWYVFRQRLCICIPTNSEIWQRESTSKQESSH